MKRQIYTDHIVRVVERMVSNGATNLEIAMAIGTTERRLQARLSQLGIRRDGNGAHHGADIRLRLSPQIATRYTQVARTRAVRTKVLIQTILETVVRDELFAAILDD